MSTRIQADSRVLDVFAQGVRTLTTATTEVEPDRFTPPPAPGVRLFATGPVRHDARTGVLEQAVRVIEYSLVGESRQVTGERLTGLTGRGELLAVLPAAGVERALLSGDVEAVATAVVVRIVPEVPAVADVSPEGVARVLARHLHDVSRRRIDVHVDSAAGSGTEFTVGLRLGLMGELSPADVAEWAAETASGAVGGTHAGVGRVAEVAVTRTGRLDDRHGGIELRVTVETASA